MIKKKRKGGWNFKAIRKVLTEVPMWVRVVGAFVAVESAGMIVAFSFNKPEVGILAFHAVILTVLAAITYQYARSTDQMARATVDLAEATREELLLRRAESEAQESITLNEMLLELRRAEEGLRPPFGVAAWERYCGRLRLMKRLTEVEKIDIERCYLHLTKENTVPNRLTDIDLAREGSVTQDKEREVRRAEDKYKEENYLLIMDAISAIERGLKEYRGVGSGPPGALFEVKAQYSAGRDWSCL